MGRRRIPPSSFLFTARRRKGEFGFSYRDTRSLSTNLRQILPLIKDSTLLTWPSPLSTLCYLISPSTLLSRVLACYPLATTRVSCCHCLLSIIVIIIRLLSHPSKPPHQVNPPTVVLATKSTTMASTSRRQQSYYTTAAPIPTPQKASTHSYSYAPLSRVSVSASPPERISANSSTAGSRTSGGTYSTPSGTGYVSSHPSAAGYVGGYGGNYEYDHSSASGNGVDVVDMLSERMNTAFEFAPTRMDEGLVKQAQT
jgi:hypothetical protein